MVASFSLNQNDEQGVQGVQDSARLDHETIAGLSWDDLRLFLHVSEGGSLRSAALRGRVAVNTVRTKLSRLEDRIGERLVTRNHQGIMLTTAGVRLRKLVKSMQSATVPGEDVSTQWLRRPNELRIVASEALGSGWLTPRLLDLQAKFPSLTMTMICDNNLNTDYSDDCDIQVGWNVPRNNDLIVSKLATVHFMPFASRDYLAAYGAPKTAEDLLQHRFIEQVSPGIKSDLLDQLVGSDRPAGFLPIRTNSSFSLFWAVANSAGIAFMPTYSPVMAQMLVPIDLPFLLKFDIYYYYRVEKRGCEIVRAGIDWLKDCFDPELYPWFQPDFVHPNDFFPKSTGNVVSIFGQFMPPSGAA